MFLLRFKILYCTYAAEWAFLWLSAAEAGDGPWRLCNNLPRSEDVFVDIEDFILSLISVSVVDINITSI